MRPVSDAQVRQLMEELSKTGKLGRAAMKAGMDRKTARKYVTAGALPSQMSEERTWRTRQDPFVEDWPAISRWLTDSPELDAKNVLEMLEEQHPGKYGAGQLRTLQRGIRRWRAAHGPERNVVFGQAHRPGEAGQTDFTSADELKVTILGQPFLHLLCVFVLPYSNWQWATACLSESLMALRRGVQAALFNLGRVPLYHQTDNSTAATHRIPNGKQASVEGRKRPFNEEYVAMTRHFGMTPRTTEVGAKEQNGDVEAGHRALKHRLNQALIRRGNRDFPSVEAWQQFVEGVVRKANGTRAQRVTEELAVMRVLDVSKLPEYHEETVKVSSWSTVRVKHAAYSVPSRLMGEKVTARIYEDRIEVHYAGDLQMVCPRLRSGEKRHRIDYRHVIWSLVRKPGAFARYVYREEMFPSLIFRRAYDAIAAVDAGVSGDLEYLRILHQAASGSEADVQAALELLLAVPSPKISSDAVKALVQARAPAPPPELTCDAVDLGPYDALLAEVAQ
jgi:hypothetical protein